MEGLRRGIETPWNDPANHPAIDITTAGRALKMSRSAAYRAAAAGHIPTIRVGSTLRVPTLALRRMLGLEA